MDRAGSAAAELGRLLGQHAEAEVLERRHRVGQRHRAAELVDLEPQLVGGIAVVAIEPRVAAQRPVAVAAARARRIRSMSCAASAAP